MKNEKSAKDAHWMDLALETARLGIGHTHPNPPVGAVLVKNDTVLSKGYHRRAGEPHAEVEALLAARGNTMGATLYVTLEPCSTYGKTPPCTDAIIKAGIARLVVGCCDPNPAHTGKALRTLRRQGMDVKLGVKQEACKSLIEFFAKWITVQRPFVTLKLATSLDGRIADATGASRWITGPRARIEVQRLRKSADAVLIGAETLRADNPSLLITGQTTRQPRRIVVTRSGRIAPDAILFADEEACRTMVFKIGEGLTVQLQSLADRGIQVVCVPDDNEEGGGVGAVVRHLGALGCLHVLCEGGGKLARSLLAARDVDRLIWFHAPMLLGGEGRASVGGSGWSLSSAPRFAIERVRRIGVDIMVSAVRDDEGNL